METAAPATDGLTFDPYNSYAFWREGRSALMGAAVRRRGAACAVGRPRKLMAADNLGPFVLNYRRFSLLVPERGRNELYLLDVERGEST